MADLHLGDSDFVVVNLVHDPVDRPPGSGGGQGRSTCCSKAAGDARQAGRLPPGCGARPAAGCRAGPRAPTAGSGSHIVPSAASCCRNSSYVTARSARRCCQSEISSRSLRQKPPKCLVYQFGHRFSRLGCLQPQGAMEIVVQVQRRLAHSRQHSALTASRRSRVTAQQDVAGKLRGGQALSREIPSRGGWRGRRCGRERR